MIRILITEFAIVSKFKIINDLKLGKGENGENGERSEC